MADALAQWQVDFDGTHSRAVFQGGTETVFVCAHGAGGHMGDAGLLRAADTLRARGFGVVRFNFPYREQGSRRPDPMPRLQACLGAVVAKTREEIRPKTLILGGRSMGGRAASMLAAEGFGCDGLLLLAYPLHPAGKPEKLRDAHLRDIQVPVLCFNGTRDALCERPRMERVLSTLQAQAWEMHWLEGADHSFHVLKSSGRTDAEVFSEIGEAAQRWRLRLS